MYVYVYGYGHAKPFFILERSLSVISKTILKQSTSVQSLDFANMYDSKIKKVPKIMQLNPV